MKCPKCTTELASNYAFCPQCGTAVSEYKPTGNQLGGSITISDVGMIKGNVDASTHIGVQITGPVSIQSAPQPPSSQELVAQARQALDLRNYRRAAALADDALAADPLNVEAGLLLALALLAGRNPSVVPRADIQRAEACLQEVARDQRAKDVALVILGAIKHDYYLANGMDEGSPHWDEIVRQVRATALSLADRQLLNHLNASPRARQLLGLDG